MKTMSLRLPDDLHDLIVEAAEAEERSRHQWIVRALERAVTQRPVGVTGRLAMDSPEAAERLEAIAAQGDTIVVGDLQKPAWVDSVALLQAQGVDPDNLRKAALAAEARIKPVPDVDPATGEILSDGPPETAMTKVRQRSQSTPTKYLVRATYKGLFWVCFVEGTELTFNVRSKPDIARTARRFLEGQTEGEFTVEVRT